MIDSRCCITLVALWLLEIGIAYYSHRNSKNKDALYKELRITSLRYVFWFVGFTAVSLFKGGD